MTDFDADEPVAPLRPAVRRRHVPTIDRLLGLTGVAMAFAAAMFPWYVFFNTEKFGIRPAEWARTRDLPEGPGREVFSVSPLALVDNDNKTTPPTEVPVDEIITATVPSLGREDAVGPEKEISQPFPGQKGFRLLHVANGRALIEDTNGMYLVRVGSILPDESRVATLEQRNGKWMIITSTGEVYENQ